MKSLMIPIVIFFLIITVIGMCADPYCYVTAYCAKKCCCGEHANGVTASNHIIQKGDKFCAAHESIPFETKVIIEGYNDGKPVRVLDRGSAIDEPWKFDVYFDDEDGISGHQRAKNWGKRKVRVTRVK